ncbi:hypothetical protein LIER_07362 [Lithospermum erythrorhizon]|uniref:Uncharacterized protein n=1 Tax=Lithospermum erythrorhizon TaxID=34254 RepID=A0AAV3P7S4_LITER
MKSLANSLQTIPFKPRGIQGNHSPIQQVGRGFPQASSSQDLLRPPRGHQSRTMSGDRQFQGVVAFVKEPKEKVPKPAVTPPPSETPGLVSQEVDYAIFLYLTEEPGVDPVGPHGIPTISRGSRLHVNVSQPSNLKNGTFPASSPSKFPISSGEGYKSDHPFFVINTLYTLPSGVQITDNSTSRTTSSLVADMFKHCMLRPEVLGTMGVHSPTRFPDQFAHYQLRATDASYAMFLKLQKTVANAKEHEREKSSFGSLLRKMREERDSALSEKEKAVEKHNELLRSWEELLTSHAASEGKQKAEIDVLSSSLEAVKDGLKGFKASLQECALEKEAQP